MSGEPGPIEVRAVGDLDRIDFRKGRGLVPVVAQDRRTGEVLMVAWADREALERTLETGELHFRSRSRDALWRKGETSGNVLRLGSLHADCDADTLLALVDPAGPACHTGTATCFGPGAAPSRGGERPTIPPDPERPGADPDVLLRLQSTLEARAGKRPDGSWTVRLLDDPNLRIKKLGEETAELVAALASGDAAGVREESADLLYHLLVALFGAGVSLEGVLGVLEGRAEGGG